jgi:hypothetical protein
MLRKDTPANMACSCIHETLMPRQLCFETPCCCRSTYILGWWKRRWQADTDMSRPYYNHVINSTVLTVWDVEILQHTNYIRRPLPFNFILSLQQNLHPSIMREVNITWGTWL